MTPEEIEHDMMTRCWEVDRLERQDTGVAGCAVGHMIQSKAGNILAIEVGIDDDGHAFASIRMFRADGTQEEPVVFAAGDSMLVSTT